MLLFSESFAATNDREGSEIARQIVSALLEKRIKVFFVTHLYEFAHGFYDAKYAERHFLAGRKADRREADFQAYGRRAIANQLWGRFV